MRLWMLALLVMAVGCKDAAGPSGRASSKASAPAKKQHLVLGTTREPNNLDPAFTRTSYDREIATFLGPQLTEFDDQGRLIPAAAAALPKLTTSTSGFDANWRLAPDHWEDGRPVTVADLKRGYEVETNPDVASINYSTAMRVKAFLPISESEFVVRYGEPFADWRAPDVLGIVPAHKYPKKVGRGFKGLPKKPLSRGPFRVASWVPGDRIELEPNPHFKEAPKLKRITIRFFPSIQGLIAALRTGLVDAVGEAGGLLPQDGHFLQEVLRDTHVVHFTRSTRFVHLRLRIDSALFGDVAVRRDLSMALDRESIKALAFRGHADNAYGMFPSSHPAHYATPIVSNEDVEKAKLRLRKHFAKSAKVIPFEFVSSPSAARYVSVLTRQLESLGMKLRLQPLPAAVLHKKVKSRSQAPLVLYTFSIRPDWDGRSVLHSEGRQNWIGLRDEALDAALDAAQEAMDPSAWAAATQRVDARVRALMPSIPLHFRQTVSVRPRDLKNWRPTGLVTPVSWNAEEWERGLEKPAEGAYPATKR